MPAEEGDLFKEVEDLLPDDMKAYFKDYQKRYFDFNNIFSLSENELVGLNNEFSNYYEAAMESKGISMPRSSEGTNNCGWMVQAMYFSMGKKHDYRNALKVVKAPVLVVHGEKDLQPQSASQIYSNAFPNAQFEVIGTTSHFPFEERPQEFSRIIGDFLESISD